MWAWAPWRIGKLKRNVDHVLCKLPFEPEWFRDRGVQAEYVGHPYFDELHHRQLNESVVEELRNESQPLITLLPGSRDQEVEQNGQILLQAAANVKKVYPNARVAVACFKSRHADRIRQWSAGLKLNVDIRVDQTPELIEAANFCLACSGSVSLELMYHRKPSVIVFRVSNFKMRMAQILLRTKFITLVNLMATSKIARVQGIYDPDADQAERVPFPEYLTTVNVADRASQWLIRWMQNPQEVKQRVMQLDELSHRFAKPGASKRAAKYIATSLGAIRESGATDQEIGEDSKRAGECLSDAA